MRETWTLLFLCGLLSACAEESVRFPEDGLSDRALIWESSYSLGVDVREASSVVFRNSGSEALAMTLQWGEFDLSSSRGLYAAIDAFSPEEFRPYVRAWQFLKELHRNYSPFSPHYWMHDPLLYLNSVGFGLCDDITSVLYEIWIAMGYRARIWGLEGHVVSEVFADGKWQLFDADHRVYFLNRQGEVASVSEIAADPSLLWSPEIKFEDAMVNAYSPEVAALYSSRDDNFFCDSDDDGQNCSSFRRIDQMLFELAPAAKLELPLNPKDPIVFNPDGDSIPDFKVARLSLPVGYEGWVRVPLVPVAVNGSGVVSISGGTFEIGEKLSTYLKNRRTFTSEFFVKSNLDSSVVIDFSLNPRVFGPAANSFTVRTNNNDSLVVESQAELTLQSSTQTLPVK